MRGCMLYLVKLLEKNKISLRTLARKMNTDSGTLCHKIKCRKDFTLKELEEIKSILVDMQIIPPEFDIGDFLNIVWGAYAWKV